MAQHKTGPFLDGSLVKYSKQCPGAMCLASPESLYFASGGFNNSKHEFIEMQMPAPIWDSAKTLAENDVELP